MSSLTRSTVAGLFFALALAGCPGGGGGTTGGSGSSTGAITSTSASSSGSSTGKATSTSGSSTGGSSTGTAAGSSTGAAAGNSTGASGGSSTGTATGGTGASGGSSTGTATGGTGGNPVCDNTGASSSEFQACTDTSNCNCPASCINSLCQNPCTTSADCDTDYATCVAGSCQIAACADGGDEQPCNFLGTGDGTCVDTGVATGSTLWACRLNGTASTSCDPFAAESSAATICGAGQDCVPIPDGGNGCLPLCNPTVASTCPSGQGCAESDLFGGDPTSGYCAPLGDGGCGLGTSAFEGSPCVDTATCPCPQLCLGIGSDAGGACAYPCTTTADCQNPTEICVGGGCTFNICGPGNAPDGGDLGPSNGPCSDLAVNDGTCYAQLVSFFGLTGISYGCEAAGTSTTSCDPTATRSQPASLCAQGYGCFSNDAGTASSCVALCNLADLDAGLGCPAGTGCYNYASAGSDFNAGDCNPLGDGGCLAGITGTGFFSCTGNVSCGCPQTCVADPNFGSLCEMPCQTTNDCDEAVTTCQSNTCQFDYCAADPAGNTVAGQYNGSCNAAATNDGTCQPFDLTDANGNVTGSYGLCSQDGTAATGATCGYVRGGPLCSGTSECLSDQNGNSACYTACTPGSDAGTCGATPNACLSFDPSNAVAGYCGTCSATGGSCNVNTDCCSGTCNIDPNNGNSCA